MKKLIPLLVLLGGAATGFAQGTVTFQNSVLFLTPDPSGLGRLVLDAPGGVGLGGSQYVAELYYGSSAGSLSPLTASISRFRATSSPSKGKWLASGINAPNDYVPLPGIDFGGNAFLQVKVWDLTAGATYETAGSGKTGASQVFAYTVPAAGDTTASHFFMEGMQGFALVPEPSAIALGVLGVAGLLLIRRRK
jgi:hypothetical protein